ncbi:TrmB family transcriptional regulator [Carbonactinospora thermoautotrophica]|uniref:TrmB family transcriptional regulator n=1 Tax=Carbonactinospora thermoautotrophica TaxID=1469144 RepID=UPI0022715BA8|nr:helix-turn-helix domain-containing protein [Carbonactinospora thermoautotrophica]MCX9192692.1 TrmB family transcriptional regulator [Carbonactinospora thermoautotrophica]
MLEPAGISADEECVYRYMIVNPPAPEETIARGVRLSSERVREALRRLESKGLVSRAPGPEEIFVPAPPDLAIEPLILRHQHQLQLMRAGVARLAEEYRAAQGLRGATPLVDVVVGAEAIEHRLQQLQESAREEILGLAKPPVVVTDVNKTELRQLAQGVRYRALYDRSVLEQPGDLWEIERYVKAGEEARVMDGVPIKLIIADRHMALLPLQNRQLDRQEPSAIVVHPSGLLDSLVALFEVLWSLATPIFCDGPTVTEGEARLSDVDLRLISLMRAGLTDEAIAKQLGQSKRTVLRRVRRLMDLTRTDTRFQLGYKVAENGWI